MAIQSATVSKQAGAFRSRFLNVILASCLALAGATAQAGALSVTSTQSNGIVVFNVFDSDPLAMCDGFICAADFAIDFDTSELEFLSGSTARDVLFGAHVPDGTSEVLVSYMPFDEAALAGPGPLFSLSFKALVSKEVELVVGPVDFGIPMPYNPTPVEVSTPVSAVPEPSSLLMGTLGLGLLAFMRRKHKAAK